MRDDINTSDASAFMDAFVQRASEEHDRRIEELRRSMDELMTHPWSRELVPAMIAMDPSHRHLLFGRVLANHEGANSIDGLEEIVGFVVRCVMDDGECHVAPYVPDAHLRKLVLDGLVARDAARGGDGREAKERFGKHLADQARWSQIGFGEGEDGRIADAEDILAAIARNEALHAEQEARSAELSARRAEANRRREAASVPKP